MRSKARPTCIVQSTEYSVVFITDCQVLPFSGQQHCDEGLRLAARLAQLEREREAERLLWLATADCVGH